MDKIGSSITQLTAMINEKAPHLRPPTFPQYLPVRDILDLTVTDTQRTFVTEWLATKGLTSAELALSTVIDYPGRKIIIDAVKIIDPAYSTLYSVDSMMELMVLGNKTDFDRMLVHFLTTNNLDDTADNRHYLEEIYNMAYTLKVLVSNVPGFGIYLGDVALPLAEDGNLTKVLEKLLKQSEDAHIGDVAAGNASEGSKVKKRKHKRSKA